MNYTNKFNLPDEIVKALTKDRYNPDGEIDLGDYSATTLCAPIQLTILKRRYPDKLRVFDVTDNFWAFVGSIAHKVLEEHGTDFNALREARLYYSVNSINGRSTNNKIRISGQVDHFKNNVLTDYKSTKAYKIIRADYEDWTKQLNVYSWLFSRNGMHVEQLRIFAFILDWKKHEIFRKGYPKCPIVEIPIKDLGITWQENFIVEQLGKLEAAAKLSDKELAEQYPCSPKEMWQDTKDWAITKEGAKRALKCFDDADEALTYPLKDGEMLVQRMTERKRCYDYCLCSKVCLQHKAMSQKEKGFKDGESDREEPIF